MLFRILPNMTYSKRHNKFLFPSPAKAIYGSFCRVENEIFNVVNYRYTKAASSAALVYLHVLFMFFYILSHLSQSELI